MQETPKPAGIHGLSLAEYLGVLAVALAVFLFANGPAWHDPYRLDVSIFLSYAIIPLAVLALLRWRRRLTWARLVLLTVELVLLKYGVTLILASLMWATTDPPPPPSSPPVLTSTAPAHPVPPPSLIPLEDTGSLRGRVQSDGGAPVAGALVYVSAGLEAYHFAAPAEVVSIENDGAGFSPPISAVHAFQPLVFVRTDRGLHTVSGLGEAGAPLFQLPVLDRAHAKPAVLGRALGRVRLLCKVHPKGEPKAAELVVLPHAFAVLTGADGGFVLSRVPAGKLELTAALPGHEARKTVELARGASAEVELVLGR